MAQKVWTIHLADGPHTVVLEHGVKSGSRSIRVDGELVDLGATSRKVFDTGSTHHFTVGGEQAEIRIQPCGFATWYYAMSIAGENLDPPLPQRRIPNWAILFVLACLLPVARIDGSLIALGVTGLLSIGGAFACIAISADPRLRTDQRVMRCFGMTGFVWFVLVAPTLMLMGVLKVMNAHVG